MTDPTEDTSKYPRLGQILGWVDRPGNDWRLVTVLIVLCVLSLLAEFTYEKHGYMEVERIFGFYAAYGFIGFTGLILVAKGLRVLISRDENYYAPHSIDTEDYPVDGSERKEHGGDKNA